IANTVMSVGFGLMFTISTDLVVGSAPPQRAGAASAISETGAEFGGALGIAVLGSVGMAVYRSQVSAAIPPGVPAEAAAAARDTLGGAIALADQLSDPLAAGLLHVARSAFTQGLHLTAITGTVVMIGLAVLVVLVLRNVDTAT